MRKVLLITSVSIIVLTSCSKIIGTLISKFMSMQTIDAQFTLPIVTDTTQQQAYGPTSSKINVDSFITAYSSGNYTIKNVKSAHIESCSITITNPDDKNNFANIQSCQVDLNSDAIQTMIHPASISNNPDQYAASIDVPVDNTIELKDYLNSKQFNYTVRAKMRRATTKEMTCTIQIKVHIEVQ